MATVYFTEVRAPSEVTLSPVYDDGRVLIKVDPFSVDVRINDTGIGQEAEGRYEVDMGLKQGDSVANLGGFDITSEYLIEEWDGSPIWRGANVDEDSSQYVGSDLRDRKPDIQPGIAQLWVSSPDDFTTPVRVVGNYPTPDDVTIKNINLSPSSQQLSATYDVETPLPYGVTATIQETVTKEDTQEVLVNNERQESIPGVARAPDTNTTELQTDINVGNGPDITAEFCANIKLIDGSEPGYEQPDDSDAEQELKNNGINPDDGISTAELRDAADLYAQGEISSEAYNLAESIWEDN